MDRHAIIWLLATLGLATSATAQTSPGSADETSPRACQNGTDDDGDGDIDCADDDCRMLIFCRHHPAREAQNEDTPCEDDPTADRPCDPPCTGDCVDTSDGTVGTLGLYMPREAEEIAPEVGFEEHSDPDHYPERWAQRPMTLREGMLVPRVGVVVDDTIGGDPTAALGLGLTYGFVDAWQLTVVAVPLRLTPEVRYENPAISTILRFAQIEELDLGVYANVAIPVGTAGSTDAREALPTHHLYARSRASDGAHVDIGLLARIRGGDWLRVDLDLPVLTLVIADRTYADLTFDARIGVSPWEYLYAGAYSGFVIRGRDYDAPKVPLGFFVGGTIPGWRRGPVLDIAARFGWPQFWDASPAAGRGSVSARQWQLTVDIAVYSYLL